MTNYAADKDLPTILAQALLTFFMGVFLSAVYLRTGNICPLILCHSLHDILAFSASDNMVVEFPDWITTYIGAVEGSLLICGLYMLRRSKRAEIIALWDQRWSRDTGVNEAA